MKASSIAACFAVVIAAGCSSSSGGSASPYIAGFSPPPVAAGYTRYTTPIITDIAAGTDVLYCQWVAAPASNDQDVLNVEGLQSAHGHHIVLYATTEAFPVGESHICTTDDMLSVRFLGAIGNEGTAAAKLPAGVGLRLNQGEYIMANTHFINAGTETIEGQGVVDVEWEAPSPTRQLATMFTDVETTFTIPPNAVYTHDETCTSQLDMPLIMFGNHMHGYGQSVLSEVIHADGSKDTLANDTTWSAEQEFNPTFTQYPVDSPYTIHSGDVVHTSCTWQNTTPTALTFPDEMCAGVGFYLAPIGTVGQEIHCIDSAWPAAN
jgi:hypothetical protein